MNSDEAIAALDAIDPNDPENDALPWPGPGGAHCEADYILVATADPAVAAAYKRVIERCKWWRYA